jgi:hypothetical protein
LPEGREKMQQLGVARYLTKPSDLEEFLRLGVVLKEILLKGAASRECPETK